MADELTAERIAQLFHEGPWGINPRTDDGFAEWQSLCRLAKLALTQPSTEAPRLTREQVQNLMLRFGGSYQQAIEALRDECGIEVSE